ncbi:hypothetical protein BDN72DRAFT_895106 [Pluteus cervinus]|uniref:Uncharacterized protein n=1 Tax=Pluteus cervinus TaxID=181527 RepID=A0ACD3B1I2_9AGAR|nr:hypothetical protein BDN72DRAFT_895106 [Pluteus cervinus]
MFAILRSRSGASSTSTTPPSPTSTAPRMQFSTSTSTQRSHQQQQPPPSPTRSHARSNSSINQHKRMSIHNLVTIFIKMREARGRANSRIIFESSGAPQTHDAVLRAMKDGHQQFNLSTRLTHTDHYICEGGVNVSTLLRATRGTLIEGAGVQGIKALSEEQWDVTIVPKKAADTFKVSVRYSASAANSSVDPHRPVALDQAKGIPGLMTIVSRG